MVQALFVELNREEQGLPSDKESPIHHYQSRTGCTYEEALAQAGYQLDTYISGGLFNFCRLYVRSSKSSSGGISTFCDGYIDVSLHATDEEGEPLHQYIYVDDFFTWVKVVRMLSTPGSSIHSWVRHSSED
jgi:hypothetical protein